MTLEEAKKILKKEIFGIRFKKFDKPLKFEEKLWIRNEKPEVLEALHIVAKNGIGVSVPETALRIRSLIIKKMKAGDGEPAPVSGTPLSAAEGMKLRWKDNKNTDKNPALEESATQFNDALLDEQAKKIAELTKEKANLEDQITVLNACKKHNDKIDRKQIKCLGKEITKLNGIIHDKNAILSDVAEELRLSKIREKNLTELCQKYIKANEELKEKLANNVVDKIDAQALKSAESALAWKEKVIAEKDDVIADLGKELTESKKRVEWVRNASKEYCDYGVAANEFIKKLSRLYILASNNGNIDVEMLERCKNYQTYGFPANCNRETKKEINDIARGKENKKPRIPTPEEPKHDNGFENFINKAIDNYNRRAAELGCAGSKDGNGIFDQMVGVDIAEEGADYSGVIVLCGNGITISKDEAKIIERCTKNGTELHYSEKDGFTYTNMYGEEMPIKCLRGLFHVFTDEELKKK